jgi:hypothetical protein
MTTDTRYLFREEDLVGSTELEDVSKNIIDDSPNGSNSCENVGTLFVEQI